MNDVCNRARGSFFDAQQKKTSGGIREEVAQNRENK